MITDNNLFTCPECGGPHFNATNGGILICASVIKSKDVTGCGWRGPVFKADESDDFKQSKYRFMNRDTGEICYGGEFTIYHDETDMEYQSRYNSTDIYMTNGLVELNAGRYRVTFYDNGEFKTTKLD